MIGLLIVPSQEKSALFQAFILASSLRISQPMGDKVQWLTKSIGLSFALTEKTGAPERKETIIQTQIYSYVSNKRQSISLGSPFKIRGYLFVYVLNICGKILAWEQL